MAAKKYRTADGVAVPSVTTVLKTLGWNSAPLMFWAFKQGQEHPDAVSPYATDDAARVGTLAHKMIEHEILGRAAPQVPPELEGRVAQAMESFHRWQSQASMELLFPEQREVSERHGYGGTLDVIARVNGKIALVDWKTSKAVYQEYLIQLAAYGHLWTENHPRMPIEEYHVLRIGKDDTAWSHHYYQDLSGAPWQAFKLALQLHKLKGEIRP